MDAAEQVLGVVNSDGDTSAGVAVVLYIAGTSLVRTLAVTEILFVTDLQVITEDGGDIFVDTDTDADGDHDAFDILMAGRLAANGGLSAHFQVHHQCARGKLPKLYASATNRDTLVLHGYVRAG